MPLPEGLLLGSCTRKRAEPCQRQGPEGGPGVPKGVLAPQSHSQPGFSFTRSVFVPGESKAKPPAGCGLRAGTCPLGTLPTPGGCGEMLRMWGGLR